MNEVKARTARAWALMLIAPVLLFVISVATVFILVARAGGDRSVINSGLQQAFPYIAMVNHTLLFLLMWRFARADGLTLGEIGWNASKVERTWWVELLVGIAAGVAIFFVQTWLAEPLVSWARGLAQTGSLRPASTPTLSVNVESLIAGTLFAGVVEESVFRGYIQRQLNARYGVVTGILIATLAFTVGLHWGLGPWSLIVVFVNGLLLALLFHWRKALLAPVVAHAMVNALVVLT